jgi:hypothetical protein
MESLLIHQAINRVTPKPEPNKKWCQTQRKQSEFRCECEHQHHEQKKMGWPVHCPQDNMMSDWLGSQFV